MHDRALSGLSQPVRTEGYLDVIQLLTGAALIIFIYMHSLLEATINLGAGVMDHVAGFLEDTYMAQMGLPIIGLIFLVHFVVAARKMPFKSREQAVIWRHSLRLNHFDTYLWLIQAGTAMVILILGSIHMWTVLADFPIKAAKSASRIQGGWWYLFFLVLIPMVQLHLGVGLYRIGVKWGWIKRDNRVSIKGIVTKVTLAFIILGFVTVTNYFFFVAAH
ncbi:MAG: succinate dehydrogenase/fumarate reductase cytochrome b subunit [Syntrophobacteraceae bacterium]